MAEIAWTDEAQRWLECRHTDPGTGRAAALLTSFPLLYDVATDVDEYYNVVERHPEEARRLLGLIEGRESDFRANPRGWR